MASWTRQNDGEFASGLRAVWRSFVEEFIAWRASINAVENAQLSAGAEFSSGHVAHTWSVSEAAISLAGCPGQSMFTMAAQPSQTLIVGGIRFRRAAVVRRVFVQLSQANTEAIIGQDDLTSDDPPDTAGLDPLTVSLRHVDRAKAGNVLDAAAPAAERPGLIAGSEVSSVVAGPVTISARMGVVDIEGVRPGFQSDFRGTEELMLPLLQTRFAAGDVLLAVVETPRFGEYEIGGTNSRVGVLRSMGDCWLRVEYAMEHGDGVGDP